MKRIFSIFSILLATSLQVNAQNVGIGTTKPPQKLSVNGGVSVGDAYEETDGTIRFHNSSMEAFDGTSWKAMTHRFVQVSLVAPFQSNINNAWVNIPGDSLTIIDTGFYIVVAETNLVSLGGPCNSFNGKIELNKSSNDYYRPIAQAYFFDIVSQNAGFGHGMNNLVYMGILNGGENIYAKVFYQTFSGSGCTWRVNASTITAVRIQ